MDGGLLSGDSHSAIRHFTIGPAAAVQVEPVASLPRDFVVEVLKGVFRLNETQALNVMVTAHRKGVCVVAVFAQDIAETKAARATEAGAAKGYPLRFGTEPEE